MSQKILHLAADEKFIPAFIRLMQDYFGSDKQTFFITGSSDKYNILESNCVIRLDSFARLRSFIFQLNVSEKVILHSLPSYELMALFIAQPWLLKKCYWVIWGSDLYYHAAKKRSFKYYLQEAIRCIVIKRIGHIIALVKGDYELAREWYQTKAIYHECLMYPSNLYCMPQVQGSRTEGLVNILVGNSADPENNHREVMRLLEGLQDRKFRIYVPLSYGDKSYADEIVKEGRKRFGADFVPIADFLPLDEYLRFLEGVDIAIFNHRRQQAMGNIITLLGMGKKIFIRKEQTHARFLSRLGVTVYDLEEFSLDPLDEDIRRKNQKIIKEYFSKENLVSQLENILIGNG